ncbi:MAG: PaaI family thioesterase [Hyphomonadaceae bacterium]
MSGAIDLNAIIATSPFCRFLNVETKVDERGVLAILPIRDQLVGNVMLPALHGGAVASFLEIACLLQLAHETGTSAPARAIDISVEYLRPARRENTFARARIRRMGKRVAVVHAEAWQSDENKPVCLLQSHLRLPSGFAAKE